MSDVVAEAPDGSTPGHGRDALMGWGAEAAQRCVDCHVPAQDPSGAIGCGSCHQSVGNRGAHDGLLIIDPTVAPAISSAAEGDTPHPVRTTGFVASPQLCGSCHEVTGPALFVETTYSDFQGSWAAAAGMRCVDCHMPRGQDGRRSHRFEGFSARNLKRALTLEVASSGGGWEVSLTNDGAGHGVPTGVSFVRDIWVEVVAYDAAGEVLAGPRRLITLGDQMVRADGDVVDLVTDAVRVLPGALGPGQSVSARVSAPVSVSAAGDGAWLTFRLMARRVREGTAEALGLGIPEALSVLEIRVELTEPAAAP